LIWKNQPVKKAGTVNRENKRERKWSLQPHAYTKPAHSFFTFVHVCFNKKNMHAHPHNATATDEKDRKPEKKMQKLSHI
jgi:hypothetical protein